MSERPGYEELAQRIQELEQAVSGFKKMEQALRESEERYRLIAENATDVIWVVDPERQTFKYVSPSVERVFGLTAEACLNRSVAKLVTPASLEYIQRTAPLRIERMLQGDTCHYTDEIDVVHKAGHIVSTEVNMHFVKNRSTGRVEATGVMRDITERKRTEAALLRAQENLCGLIENINGSVWSVDRNYCLLEGNPVFHRMVSEYGGKAFQSGESVLPSAFPAEVLEAWRGYYDRAMQGESFKVEMEAQPLSSLPIMEHHFNPLRDSGGSVKGVTVFGIDITERKRAEQERLANLQFFESMDRVNRALQGTDDLEQVMGDVLDEVLSIFDCDRAFLLYPCDPEAASWYAPMERTKPEYPGAHAMQLVAPMDPDVSRVFRLLLESDGPVKFGPDAEHPLPREMSQRFGYKSQILMALHPKTGAPWIFGLHQCAYPRVWTQQEEVLLKEIGWGRLADGLTSLLMNRKLRESEEKYRKMMEAFVEPLYICSHDFIVEYMNPAMIRRLGRDATGESCYTALHGLSSKCEWCISDRVTKGENSEINIKSPLDDRHYRVANMPIQNQDGTISKMTIFRDVTDYVEAIAEKEKAQAQLAQSQKMESIGNLAGGIAHDFNNILSSILGFTELALDDVEKNSMMADNLQEVYTAGRRAKALVAQILAFARQSEEKLQPIQIDTILKEVLQFIRSSIPSSIEIDDKIDSDSIIMGNQTQMHQIIMNLCTNAAHAMEDEGGVLGISLNDINVDENMGQKLDLTRGDYIEISISDTGTGISPEIMDSIFEPYFTTKGPGEGTGMGLAVVHGIVESYGGKIVVESELGKGTTFAIFLPITRIRNIQAQYVPAQLPTGSERILFVDDEVPIAKIGSKSLERLGYRVTSRTSSVEALELFKSKPEDFDLVITDMTMPNLTGDNLAIELMKIRPDIPVILCTGYSRKISDKIASEIGIMAFAHKPIVKAELAKTVRKVLDEVKTRSAIT
jgi:PAS domain S-box-containing protein